MPIDGAPAMPDNRCPSIEVLTALSLGKLSDAELTEIAPHLETCAECQASLSRIESEAAQNQLKERFRGAPAKQTMVDLPPSTDVKLAAPSKRRPELPAGTLMGEYELLVRIGVGGMGEVYKARHKRMNRVVALKIMSPDAMFDEQSIKRFQREAEAAARLEHPNIVTAHDAGQADDRHFLVMQFVDGVDLSTLVRRDGPLSVERAVDYVIQAAQGLGYAHAEGVIHRDIKPSNLLLDRKGVVKILDMGLARIEDAGNAEALTGSDQVMGTIDYMSPEQSHDTKHVDARTDVYSLGCTLWYLLTGKRAYDGDTLVKRLMKHRTEPPPSLVKVRDDVDWPLELIFHKMVAKEPGQRHSTMAEVIAALSPYRGATAGTSDSRSTAPSGEMASFLQTMQKGSGATGKGAPTATRPDAKTPPQVDTAATTAIKQPEIPSDSQTQNIIRKAIEQPRPSGPQQSAKRKPSPRSRVWYAVGGIAAAGVIIAAAVLVLNHGKNSSDQPQAVAPPVPVPAPQALTPPIAAAPFDAAAARKHQEAWAAHLNVPVESMNSNDMRLTLIPPGTFQMGISPKEAENARREGFGLTSPHYLGAAKQHAVELTTPFLIGTTEVTIAQFRRFIAETGYQTVAETNGKGGGYWDTSKNATVYRADKNWSNAFDSMSDDCAVTMITFDDAVAFCNWLSKREGLTPAFTQRSLDPDADGYRLPTEAEWEFACRAGTTTRFYWGDSEAVGPLHEWQGLKHANRDPDRRSYPVGGKLANPFGVFDMLGNVEEWCADTYDVNYYAISPTKDPLATTENIATSTVRRGNSTTQGFFSSAGRRGAERRAALAESGFRIARTIASPMPMLPAKNSLPAPPSAVAPFDAPTARNIQESWGTYLNLPVESRGANDTPLTLIPPGEFLMGSPAEESKAFAAADDENIARMEPSLKKSEPQHAVALTKPYLLGTTEVTVSQFRRFVEATGYRTAAETNSSGGAYWDAKSGKMVYRRDRNWSNAFDSQTDDCAVVQTTFNDAVTYCNWLSEMEGLEKAFVYSDGDWRLIPNQPGYRLPTEAEWECACRAGTTTRFYWGDVEAGGPEFEWQKPPFGDRDPDRRSYPVAKKRPNPFGLFDMMGNVLEICADVYDPNFYSTSPRINPIALSGPAANQRVIRGDGWGNIDFRSAGRGSENKSNPNCMVGFRVARSLLDAETRHDAVNNLPTDAVENIIVRLEDRSPDRVAAEWVVSIGGEVTVKPVTPTGAGELVCLRRDELPPSHFHLIGASFADVPQLNDDELQKLDRLRSLRELSLTRVPVSIAGLRRLAPTAKFQSFVLSEMQVGPGLVDWLLSQTNLRSLTVFRTELAAGDVARLAHLTQLKELRIYHTNVADDDVAALLAPRQLSSLTIESDGVTDVGLAEAISHGELRFLGISSDKITDDGLKSVAAALHLGTFSVYDSPITDRGAAYLKDHPGITGLSLHGTKITDETIDVLISIPNLTKVSLGRSGVTQAGIDRLREAKPNLTVQLLGPLAPAN